MSIEVCAGSFSYKKDKPVLLDVSFCARRGEVIAILGPNGVGKTTLLKCMLGFIPWDKGSTRLDGQDLKNYKSRKLWQRIAYVPQAKDPVLTYNTQDMVLLGRSPYLGNFAVPGKKDKEIAMQAMELAGITHLAGKSCSRISGGELQLVLIARALAAQPEYLILDEPESGLDFRNQIVVLDLIRRLSREQNLTVIINTHYPDHALRISDQSLLLSGNGVNLFGRTQHILTEEHMRSAFGVDIAIRESQVGEKKYTAVIPLEIVKNE